MRKDDMANTLGPHRDIEHHVLERFHKLVYLYAHEGIKNSDGLIDQCTTVVKSRTAPKELIEFLQSLGYNMFHKQKSIAFDKKEDDDHYVDDFLIDNEDDNLKFFKAPNNFCFVFTHLVNEETKTETEKINSYTFNVAGSNSDIADDIQKIFEYCNKIKKQPFKLGEIYTIASSSDGFYFSKMGSEGEEYIKTNYSDDHAEVRDYILEQLNSKKPNGRLNILFGPPGTGKTHFIKSLLGHVESSIFVYIPPHLVPEISNPSFITAIIEQRRCYPNKKVIFVIEDADQVLATRMADNISDINGLLNLTDGFLASSFDIRIIATTNSKIQDLDAAIMRPGRLCVKLNFGTLNKEQAALCYKNITDGQDLAVISNKNEYTLAELYALAAESKAPAIAASEGNRKSFGF